MHRGESDKRGIYGETSPEQAEALADEGIARHPWFACDGEGVFGPSSTVPASNRILYNPRRGGDAALHVSYRQLYARLLVTVRRPRRRYKPGGDAERKSEHDALPFCLTPNPVGPSRPGMETGLDMRGSTWV